MKVPKSLQSVLWSYDISKMDIKEDKNLIIQQILNYGTEKQLKWLFKNYSEKDIKKVVKDPRRGCWHRIVLNYWTQVLNIKLDENTFELATNDLVPSIKKRKALDNLFSKVKI